MFTLNYVGGGTPIPALSQRLGVGAQCPSVTD